jgi:putative hemin transport protein
MNEIVTFETPTSRDPAALKYRWRALLVDRPNLRIRDAAAHLNVSEAELLALDCGHRVTRLNGDWRALIQELPKLGPLLALTRNEHAVHEKHGAYRNISFTGTQGLVLAEQIDLRLFMSRWHSGFAERDRRQGKDQFSLQFFDRDGSAVHKVYLREDSDFQAYEALVERYCARDQSPIQPVEPAPSRRVRPDEEVDRAGLQEAWQRLQDTHDFHPMLLRFEVERLQALRLADDELARSVGVERVEHVLTQAAAAGLPIMVFVGNPGAIQIHTGPIRQLKRTGEWLNVLDPDFDFHLRDTGIASVWRVRKPTEDGVVSSLELYDAAGATIAQFFGKRKPGQPELPEWRSLLDGLPPEAPARTAA